MGSGGGGGREHCGEAGRPLGRPLAKVGCLEAAPQASFPLTSPTSSPGECDLLLDNWEKGTLVD